MSSGITGIKTESDIQRTTKIQDAFEELQVDEKFEKIYSAVERELISKRIPKTAEHIFPIIHAVLSAQKYQYVKNKAVAHGIIKMEMDCNILTGLYIDLCQKLGVKAQGGYYPGHVFVIGEDASGKEYWWEATSGFHSTVATYSEKKEAFGRLTPELQAQGYPLKISANKFGWTHDVEVAGLLAAKGNLAEAINFYEKALGSEPLNFESLANLCQIYSMLGAQNFDLEMLMKAKTQVAQALRIQKNEHLLECKKTIDANILKFQAMQIDSIESLSGVWELESVIATKTSEKNNQDAIVLDLEMRDSTTGKSFILSAQSNSFDAKTGKSELCIAIKSFVGKTLARYEGQDAKNLLKKLNVYGDAYCLQQALAGMIDHVSGENPKGLRLMPKLIFLAKHWGVAELTVHVKETGIYHIKFLSDQNVQGNFSPDREFLAKNKITLSSNQIWKSEFVFRDHFLYTHVGNLNEERLNRLGLALNSSNEQILLALRKKLNIQESTPPVFQIVSDETNQRSLLFSVLGMTTEHESIYGQLIGAATDRTEAGLFFDPSVDLKSALNSKGGTLVSYARLHTDPVRAAQIAQAAQQIAEGEKNKVKKENRSSQKIVLTDFDSETPMTLKPNPNSPTGGYSVQIDRPNNSNHPDLPPFLVPPIAQVQPTVTTKPIESTTSVEPTTERELPALRNEITKMRDWRNEEKKSPSIVEQVQKKLEPVVSFFGKVVGDVSDWFTDHKDPIGTVYKPVPKGSITVGYGTTFEDIKIDSDFYIQQTHVTEEQFDQVMKDTKKLFPYSSENQFKYRVKKRLGNIATVSWYDAVEYCRQLSLIDSDLPESIKAEIKLMDSTEYQEFAYANRFDKLYGKLYRMAMQDEWAYAATAGQNRDLYPYGSYRAPEYEGSFIYEHDGGANELGIFMRDPIHEWTGTSLESWGLSADGEKVSIKMARHGARHHGASKTLDYAFRPVRNMK